MPTIQTQIGYALTRDIAGYDFDAKKIKGNISCPEVVRTALVKPLLEAISNDNIEVKDFKNTTSISYENRKVNVSVWHFNVADMQRPEGMFATALKIKATNMVVFCVQFYENGKFVSNVNKFGTIKRIVALNPKNGDDKLFALAKQEAVGLVNSLKESVNAFLGGTSIADVLISKLPSNVKVNKQNNTKFSATLSHDGFAVNIAYADHNLQIVFPHHYTETDFVYGNQYAPDASQTFKITSSEEADKFDLMQAIKDVAKTRSVTITHRGSLGS